MTTYKAQLKDDNGNVVYPDVGIDLDNVVTTGQGNPTTPTPWVQLSDIIWSSVIDKIYPVGSIFMSATLSTAAAVGNALGGTWIAWGAGRVPVGVNAEDTTFSDVETTGGEKNHKLVGSELPKVTITTGHTSYTDLAWTASGAASHTFSYGAPSNVQEGQNTGTETHAIHTFTFGNNGYHNNLQPYITCYMYKRTA